MIRKPARHDDITIREADLPRTWPVTVERNGSPLDLSGSTVVVRLLDDGVEVGQLAVDKTSAATGRVLLTLNADLYALIKRYSTWQLRENSVFNDVLIEGRLVKEA